MAQRAAFNADTAVGFCATCANKMPKTCSDEQKKIERKCGVDKGDNEDFKDSRERRNERITRSNVGKPRDQQKKTIQVRNMTWKDAHCGPALVNPNAANVQDRMKELQQYSDEIIDDIGERLKDFGIELVKEKAEHYLVKAGVRYAVTPVCAGVGAAAGAPAAGVGAAPGAVAGGGVCATAISIWNAADAVWTVLSGAWDIYWAKDEIQKALERVLSIKDQAQKVMDAASDPEKLEKMQTELSEKMADAASLEPCLKARKCFLAPYKKENQGGNEMRQEGPGQRKGMFDKGIINLSDSRGCCPGQTGHHLVPKAMVGHCPGYDHGAAPVICAEGAGHSQGSHGKLHAALDAIVERQHSDGSPMSMDQLVDHAAESMEDAGVGDHCKTKCIKEQLKRYVTS